MKTNKNTPNNSKPEIKFFGLPVRCSKTDRPAYEKLIASLFLHPQITSEHVKRYLDLLDKKIMSIDRLSKLIDSGVNNLLYYQSTGCNLSETMHDKIQDWVEAFGEPSTSDWDYLVKHYGIGRDDLMDFSIHPTRTFFHSAKEMATYVKQFVICQDEAVESFSVPVFQQNESKRKHLSFRIATPMVLMGRTGSGKSEMCLQFQRICDCPIIRINSNEIVPTSWKGLHLTDILVRAIKNGYTLDDLKYSIIILDEFDKIAHFNQKRAGENGTDFDSDMMRDIMRLFDSGQDLFLEDGFNPDGSPKGYKLPVDNLLVVFAGAFSGIEEIVRKRLHLNKSIGFSQMASSATGIDALLKQVTSEDLIEWGFMPELIGRIGNICALNSLTSDMIYTIMTNAKDNVLQSHINYCHQYNIDLHFTPEALRLIADAAYRSGLGFRNVSTLLSKCLTPLYYELCDLSEKKEMQTVNIDKDYIVKQLNLFTK